jgi:hypothetical protein
LLTFALAEAGYAAVGHVFKVLPQFLDQQGRESLTPSLYDRDAYQAQLRLTPTNISTMRFAVQWKTWAGKSDSIKLRVELRGAVESGLPNQLSVDYPLTTRHAFSHWDYVVLDKEKYQAFGKMTAWRVTLWDGDQLLDEQKSFLW